MPFKSIDINTNGKPSELPVFLKSDFYENYG